LSGMPLLGMAASLQEVCLVPPSWLRIRVPAQQFLAAEIFGAR
jgi:hypothetical protein